MKAAPGTATPRIETLLDAMHRDLNALHERRSALVRSGIDRNHLPDGVALMAFALLGNHGRDALLAQISGHWASLQSKGLVYGAIDDAPTAELRLLALALPHAEVIGPVWRQLRETAEANEPPREVWRCPTRVRGLWGEEARLHFSLKGVSHLLIAPDPIFGLQPAMLAVDPDGGHTGWFAFPTDNGNITISLLHRSGEVYRHVVEARVGEAA
jgi:hypothetical protein